MINCGHCNGSHETIAQAKVCAKNHNYVWAKRTEPGAVVARPAPVRTLRPVKPTEERRERTRQQLIADIREAGQSVPEGHYALETRTGPNDVTFYHVTKGRNGSTFVKQLLSDEEHKLSWERQLEALVRIGANVELAMVLFGRKTTRCGHCHRRLTNKESRERGIGPVCAAKMGFHAA
jgi:hypothetical protein